MPRVIGSGPVLADVADDCCISHKLCLFAIAGVVKDLLVFCPANIFELLYALGVDLAAALVG